MRPVFRHVASRWWSRLAKLPVVEVVEQEDPPPNCTIYHDVTEFWCSKWRHPTLALLPSLHSKLRELLRLACCPLSACQSVAVKSPSSGLWQWSRVLRSFLSGTGCCSWCLSDKNLQKQSLNQWWSTGSPPMLKSVDTKNGLRQLELKMMVVTE